MARHRNRADLHGIWRFRLCYLRRVLYRNKEVIVVGGGNSAVEEALYLSNLAKTVTVVHRRDAFRAEKILQERLFAKPNVKVIWDHEVLEYLGTPAKPPMPASVNGVKLRNTKTGETSDMAIDGVFVAIGHAPAVELFKGKLRQKPNGYLWTAPDSPRPTSRASSPPAT